MKTFISAQGGDPSTIDNPDLLPQAKYAIELPSKQAGWVSEMGADEIGHAAMLLGAGRKTKDSTIDLSVGIVLKKKIGDYVEEGESLLTIYSNNENVDEVKNKLYECIKISSEEVAKLPLIYEVIS